MDMHRWPVRVYYEDTDSGGVVYYANYLKFMERARTEWLRAVGIEQNRLLSEYRSLFMVRSATVDYRRPARFNDLLEVQSRIIRRGGASVVFEQQVCDQGGQLLCRGEIKIVCVNADTFKPTAIPEIMHTELSSDL